MILEKSVYVHIVTYNHRNYIARSIEAVLSQEDFLPGKNLTLHVSDNCSTDGTFEELDQFSGLNIIIQKNQTNLGFSTAHNIALSAFLKSDKQYFLFLNPDLRLEKNAVSKLIAAIHADPKIGSACPKLYRADEELQAVEPRILDAAGMHMTASLRHLDRGSNQAEEGRFNVKAFVFGGSGACLLLKREFVLDAILSQPEFEADVASVYPQLTQAPSDKAELLDEAFFAYREDADLAWRAQLLGWKCLYVPEAIGYHVRRVTPEKREELAEELNLLGVKNRFLLQLNNYTFSYGLKIFLLGYCFRNVLVLLGILLKERSSIQAIPQILKLLKRALNRRKLLALRIRCPHSEVAKWFSVDSMEYKNGI